MELSTDPQEDLLGVRPPYHEPDQILDLTVGNPAPSTSVIPIPSDLRVHHAGQSETSRQGEREVLVVQDLCGEILIAQRLEEI